MAGIWTPPKASSGPRLRDLEIATREASRIVDVALILRRAADKSLLLGAGGRWDRIQQRYLPYKPGRVRFIDLEESQIEFTRWYADWLAAFRDGRPRDVS